MLTAITTVEPHRNANGPLGPVDRTGTCIISLEKCGTNIELHRHMGRGRRILQCAYERVAGQPESGKCNFIIINKIFSNISAQHTLTVAFGAEMAVFVKPGQCEKMNRPFLAGYR